jgi:hypothetical protein
MIFSVQPAYALTNETYANLTIAEVISTTLAQDPIFFCTDDTANTFAVGAPDTQADDGGTTYDCNDDGQINGWPVNLTIEEVTNVDTKTEVASNLSTYQPTGQCSPGDILDDYTTFSENTTLAEGKALSTTYQSFSNWTLSASATDLWIDIYWWHEMSAITWCEAGEYYIGVFICTVATWDTC